MDSRTRKAGERLDEDVILACSSNNKVNEDFREEVTQIVSQLIGEAEV